MPEQPAAERTEQPTQRRLEKARSEGKVPQSQELPSVVTLLVLVATVALLAPSLFQWLATQVKQGMLAGKLPVFASGRAFMNFINGKITDTILVICPILTALLAASALSCIAISGWNFAPAAIRLRWDVINPASGLEKLVNARSLVHFAVSVLKLLFVSIIVWLYLRTRLDTLAALRWAWSAQIIAVTGKIILGLMIRIGIALLIIALADAMYQKWKYIQELKMTRQEVRQDLRDTEGSPEVKGRIRRIQFELALRRISAEVPKATVVLVNPTHVAVALRYEAKTMEAPLVVAKGAGHLAEKIRETARAYGVPVVRRPELARTIYSTVEPGEFIPETLYVAVAEVLAMIYRLRHSKV
ncbi:MAG TPA: flagellar biosynthesis protein FlhB [Sedimentisphaerales bacterium]|nr:flagellar biosynthesis protein FlhB [Sedimentisphaerales bacterium]